MNALLKLDESCIRHLLCLPIVLSIGAVVPAQSQEAPGGDFDPRSFSGDWNRDTSVVSYGTVTALDDAPFTGVGRELFLANEPGYGPNAREFDRNDPMGRCEPTGVPRHLNAEVRRPHNTFEIIQMEDRILQLFEYRHDWREIWMDGRELPALEDIFPTWNGYSVGRFEGDTLVVESIGFDERTWLDKFGHPHSEEMRLEERYRRIDADTLELTMTVTDPMMYSEPWESDTKIYTLDRDKYHNWDEQIYCIPAEEFSFHELIGTGNRIE